MALVLIIATTLMTMKIMVTISCHIMMTLTALLTMAIGIRLVVILGHP